MCLLEIRLISNGDMDGLLYGAYFGQASVLSNLRVFKIQAIRDNQEDFFVPTAAFLLCA